MPGKRPRAGAHLRRTTTSMSLFTPVEPAATSSTQCRSDPTVHAPPDRDRDWRPGSSATAVPPAAAGDRSAPSIAAGDRSSPSIAAGDRSAPSIAAAVEAPPLLPKPTLLISSAKLVFESQQQHTAAAHFLDFCFLCRKSIGHGRDVFIYRGDRAFCSAECRHRQIAADEKKREKIMCRSAPGFEPNEAALAA